MYASVIASVGLQLLHEASPVEHPSDRGRCSVLGPRHALSDTLTATDVSQWETPCPSVSRMSAPDWLPRAGPCHPVAVAPSAGAARLLEERETGRIDENKPVINTNGRSCAWKWYHRSPGSRRRKRYRSSSKAALNAVSDGVHWQRQSSVQRRFFFKLRLPHLLAHWLRDSFKLKRKKAFEWRNWTQNGKRKGESEQRRSPSTFSVSLPCNGQTSSAPVSVFTAAGRK